MKITELKLAGVKLVEPDCYGDARGYFFETWNQQRYSELGMSEQFVQDNVSFSQQGVLRGLHLQNPQGQGKLVSALVGDIFDVAVDLRPSSATYKQWLGVTLSAENHHQLYIPPGFAHGFCVQSETALVSYKCTTAYTPANEYCLRWDDPDVGIDWPVQNPSLSAKDAIGFLLNELPAQALQEHEN